MSSFLCFSRIFFAFFLLSSLNMPHSFPPIPVAHSCKLNSIFLIIVLRFFFKVLYQISIVDECGFHLLCPLFSLKQCYVEWEQPLTAFDSADDDGMTHSYWWKWREYSVPAFYDFHLPQVSQLLMTERSLHRNKRLGWMGWTQVNGNHSHISQLRLFWNKLTNNSVDCVRVREFNGLKTINFSSSVA